MPYYFFKKKNFIILIDKLSKNYGKNIVSAIKNLYFIKNTIIIVLTSPFILKFFQIFSKNFSVNLVYVENTAAEIIRKNLIGLVISILGALIVGYKYEEVNKLLDKDSIDKDKKVFLKNYLNIKRYYFFLTVAFIIGLSILLSYIKIN